MASPCVYVGRANSPQLARGSSYLQFFNRVPRKLQLSRHSADMPIMKKLRLLFYCLAFLEIILLTAYEAWGKSVLR